MTASMNDCVQSRQYQTNQVKKGTAQDDLFKRVAELLVQKGVEVQGSGSISLDLSEDGEIKVIGGIKNKREIENALAGDGQLKEILNNNSSQREATTSKSQPTDSAQLSDQALLKYTEQSSRASSGIYSQVSADTKASTKTEKSYQDNIVIDQNGLYTQNLKKFDPSTATDLNGVETLSDLNISSRDLAAEVGGRENAKRMALYSLLEIPEDVIAESIIEIKEYLGDRISERKEGVNEFVQKALVDNDIVLGDTENLDFALNQRGEISVIPKTNAQKDKEHAEKIEGVLNNDKEVQEQLAGMMIELDLDTRALMSLGSISMGGANNNLKFQTSEELLVDLAEYKYDNPIRDVVNNDAMKSEDSTVHEIMTYIQKRFYGNDYEYNDILNEKSTSKPDQLSETSKILRYVERRNAVHKAETAVSAGGADRNPREIKQLRTSIFSIKGDRIKSENTEKMVTNLWKGLKRDVLDSLNKGIYGRGKNLVGIENGDVQPVGEFEVVVDRDGKVEFIAGQNIVGVELDDSEIESVKAVLGCDQNDNSKNLKSIIKQTLEEHDFEHDDVEEYEHKVRIKAGKKEGFEYQIISPEADKKATKELQVNLGELNTELNGKFKEQGVLNEVAISVTEEGKLEADTTTLDAGDATVVQGIMDKINKEVAKDAKAKENEEKEHEEIKEEEKELRVKDEEELEQLKSEKNITLEVKKEAREKRVQIELEKYVAKGNKEIEGEEGDETASSDEIDKEKEVNIIQLENPDEIPVGMKGFGEILALAKEIPSILEKFHERENLLAAIER